MIAHHLLVLGEPVAEKAIRTVAVYLGLLLLLRLAGKRDLAELNTFDLVVLLLLSNVVQNAVIGDDNSLAGGLLGATVLVVGNAVVVRLVRRSDKGVRFFEGAPTVLVEHGRFRDDAIRHLGLRHADVMAALLRQNAAVATDVASAVLEPGGSIVVELEEDAMAATKADVTRLEAKIDQLLAGLP